MTVLDLTAPAPACGAALAEIRGGGTCTARATRPSGLCGNHDRQRIRREEQARAARQRAASAHRVLARTGPAARALIGLGFEAHPRLSGVLLTIDAAERLVARLTHTEGAAQ